MRQQEFTVTTDWVRVSRTFVADTTGTLDDDNAQSFRLNFWLHGGSTYTGGTHTDNVWHTTANQRIGDSQTSFFDSTDRTFFITGVQLEVGQNATEFEHEPFEETLHKCQRYFFKYIVDGYSLGAGMWYQANQVLGYNKYPRTMRAAPTMSNSGAGCVYCYTQNSFRTQGGGSVHDNIGIDSLRWNFTTTSNGTIGDGTHIQIAGANHIQGDAEL